MVAAATGQAFIGGSDGALPRYFAQALAGGAVARAWSPMR